MSEIIKQEVDFKKYCPLCKHYKQAEREEPCNECLGIGANDNTTRPLYFEEEKH